MTPRDTNAGASLEELEAVIITAAQKTVAQFADAFRACPDRDWLLRRYGPLVALIENETAMQALATGDVAQGGWVVGRLTEAMFEIEDRCETV